MTPDPFTSDGRRADAERGTDGQVAKSVRHLLSEDRTCELLGIQVESAADGRARARMRVRPDMVNGHAIGHGGFTFTLADSAFAFACNSYNRSTVAAACEIRFLAPTRLGDVLVAEAVERSRAGRDGVYDITVRRADTVVAECAGRSKERRGPRFDAGPGAEEG